MAGSKTLLVMLTAAVLLVTAAAQPNPDPDEDAIRAVVQHYFDGGMEMRKAFLPQANMWYVGDGELRHVPIQDFLARVESSAGNSVDSEVEKRVVSIDRYRDAAVAKLELRRPNSVIYDYMSLLKVGGEWIIVNKIFARGTPE